MDQFADLSLVEKMHKVGYALLEMEESIDVLMHNASVYLKKKTVTADGLKTTFTVNYLAPFVITYILKDKFKRKDKGRIIFVSSEGYQFAACGLNVNDLNFKKEKYSGLEAYGSSKLAQILSMTMFNEYFKGSSVTINAMHPGMVRKATGRYNGPLYLWFKHNIIDRLPDYSEISAKALYYLGVSKNLVGVSGKFFNLTTEEEMT
ncbi:MAG: SDR family NAD(P)-dependent oxidoreductase [Caldisericum exile]